VSGPNAAGGTCAVADRSNLGRLIATGPDLLGLLHRLSTGDLKDLRPGDGCETVITTAKGRIVERLFVCQLGDDGVLLVAGPGGAPRVLAHLQRFTFAEKTGVSDVTAETFAFALIGPRWVEAARAAGIPELQPNGVCAVTLASTRVHAVRTNGYDPNGVLVIGPHTAAEPVGAALVEAAAAEGGGMIGADALESWRIASGLPASGHELTEDYNPLEAGLRTAVSFTKGCYVGQEVIARLNTYGKVSRGLVRLELEKGNPVPTLGAPILMDGNAVGTVTSAALPPGGGGAIALGFVKLRELPPATTTLAIDDAGISRSATLIRL
jgi:folate-binding protein YgfZ